MSVPAPDIAFGLIEAHIDRSGGWWTVSVREDGGEWRNLKAARTSREAEARIRELGENRSSIIRIHWFTAPDHPVEGTLQ